MEVVTHGSGVGASRMRLHRTLVLTSPEMRGGDVRELQKLLAEFHCYHGKIDGEYGPLTAQAVYRAKWRLGYPDKDLSQKAGPVLWNFLTGADHPSRQMVRVAHARATRKHVGVPLGKRMVEVEMTQVGIHESPAGSNLQKFGAWYGENGVAWCAIFQSWSAAQVGLHFRYAWVPAVVNDARAGANGLTLVHASAIFPGCLACFDWDGDGIADHIGIVRHRISATMFATVEGNTSGTNNSNGGEVMARDDRYFSEVLAFVKIGGST